MLVALTIYNSIKFWFIYSKFGLQPFTVNTPKVIALLIVTYGISRLIPVSNDSFWLTLMGIAAKSIVIVGVFVGGVFGLRISEDANHVLLSIWHKICKKRH